MPEDGEKSPEEQDAAAQGDAAEAAQPAEGAAGAEPTEETSTATAQEENISQEELDDLIAEAANQMPEKSDEDGAEGEAAPYDFKEVQPAGAGDKDRNINMLMDVSLNLRVELGRRKMNIEDILRLAPGSVVELDKLAGDSLDILVNNRLVARGEVLVLNDNFCIRVTSIIPPEESQRD